MESSSGRAGATATVPTSTRWAATLEVIRVFLAITFGTYGLVKVFHYPAVKYFALGYTVLLAVLLWADREKLSLLLLNRAQARAQTKGESDAPERADRRDRSRSNSGTVPQRAGNLW